MNLAIAHLRGVLRQREIAPSIDSTQPDEFLTAEPEVQVLQLTMIR